MSDYVSHPPVEKRFLKDEFEMIVSQVCSVLTPFGRFKVLTWLITLDESTRKIWLNAVTQQGLYPTCSSFPFGSVTRAYQFMVRL